MPPDSPGGPAPEEIPAHLRDLWFPPVPSPFQPTPHSSDRNPPKTAPFLHHQKLVMYLFLLFFLLTPGV